MAADYSRVHRLLKILALIQGGVGWTARRLAQECGTTERTIYRDLNMLEGAGVPCFFDPLRKSYGVRGDFFMPPVQLSLDETLALSALAEHVGGREQIPFMRAAARALAKVRGQLPPTLRSELERLESHVAIQLAASSPPEAAHDVYQKVQHAMATRTSLRCKYSSTKPDPASDGRSAKEFRFDPYALLFSTRAWYVIGHHHGHREIRCLKLSRFDMIQLTSAHYDIPPGFSLEKHLGYAWRMIRGTTRYRVELHFDRQFAETIADTHWHRTQEIDWLDDQTIRFRCAVDGLDEIVWWVLGMGPHCRVIKPKELAERIRQLASGILSLYGSEESKPKPISRRKPSGKP